MSRYLLKLAVVTTLLSMWLPLPLLQAAAPTDPPTASQCCKSNRSIEPQLAQRNQYRAPPPVYRQPSPTYRPPANQNQPRAQIPQQRQQMQQQMRQRVDQQRAQVQRLQAERRQQVTAQRARLAQDRADQTRRNQERMRFNQTQQQEKLTQQKKLDEVKRNAAIGAAGVSIAVLAAIAVPPHLHGRLANLTERVLPANDNAPKPAAAGGGKSGGGDGTDGGGPGKGSLTSAFNKTVGLPNALAAGVRLSPSSLNRIVQLKPSLLAREYPAAKLAEKDFGKLGIVVAAPPKPTINGLERHYITQSRSREAPFYAVSRAIRQPLVVFHQGGGKHLFVGTLAAVVIDSEGQLVTAYGKSYYKEDILSILKEIE